MDKSTIKKLLVPLDGSSLAESVLPVAAQVARKIHAAITLIHVIEKHPPEKIHGQRHLTNAEQAEKYLRTMGSFKIFEGIDVHFHLHEAGVRDVSQSISDHTEELEQDLVIMCTHGSSGLRGMLFGSIAQQVISFGNVPVLLVNPSSENSKYKFENFLVPLDGNPDHEQSLTYASILARMCGAKIHLLIAIPHLVSMSGELTPANRFLPGTTSKMMDMIVPDAKEYLSRLQTKIELAGIEVTTRTSRNEPSTAIPKTAKSTRADLIILATHGKKGTEAFWSGSVAPKISKSSKIPLLLVPIKE
ncbi:MAG: universal stress protein [Candidatus Kryptoniota bacterium]